MADHIDRYPESCPYCYRYIKAIHRWENIPYEDSNLYYIVLQCPDAGCQKLFLAVYKEGKKEDSAEWVLDHIISEKQNATKFDPYISDISEKFVDIYGQAFKAEQMGLGDACGATYRKALEILVKDYAIKKTIKEDPEADSVEETIKKQPLAKCINEYFKDGKLKEIANRAAWLGNDEVHYYKLWGKDYEKLREAIMLVVYYIMQEKAADDLLEEMNNPKSGK
ncbi:MAG: DUF4145 domain-containing protein [Ignavibacteriales bacterium]|nr:DUF4145 domain-containing protein [Ignavibacteriales bacterium]